MPGSPTTPAHAPTQDPETHAVPAAQTFGLPPTHAPAEHAAPTVQPSSRVQAVPSGTGTCEVPLASQTSSVHGLWSFTGTQEPPPVPPPPAPPPALPALPLLLLLLVELAPPEPEEDDAALEAEVVVLEEEVAPEVDDAVVCKTSLAQAVASKARSAGLRRHGFMMLPGLSQLRGAGHSGSGGGSLGATPSRS
jgi:hypothetical protein